MLRRYFESIGIKKDDKKDDLKGDDKDEGFPEIHDCFMIYGGPSTRQRKRECREVFSVQPATLLFLDWSEVAITFDRSDHPDYVPNPRVYPLVVDPIITNTRLTKVFMDGGSSLNIIYAQILDLLGIVRTCLQPSVRGFHGVVPGKRAESVGWVDLPVCFGTPANFRKETLTFEVVRFYGTYHAILGCPCYVRFMAVPNYTYLKLKMLGPNGVITVRPLKRTTSGFTHLLVAIDKFSKWIEAHPITNIRSEQAVLFFIDIVHRFGVPNCIITDNDTQFTGKKFLDFCDNHHIRVLWSVVVHPKTNGQVEHANDRSYKA
jgi:hypothetical protein